MNILEKINRRRNWSDEELQILAQVQRMADEVIAPRAAQVDATGEFPWENVRAISALGLNTMFLPEAYGGSPTRYALYLEIVSIISEACASTGIIYATTFHGMK